MYFWTHNSNNLANQTKLFPTAFSTNNIGRGISQLGPFQQSRNLLTFQHPIIVKTVRTNTFTSHDNVTLLHNPHNSVIDQVITLSVITQGCRDFQTRYYCIRDHDNKTLYLLRYTCNQMIIHTVHPLITRRVRLVDTFLISNLLMSSVLKDIFSVFH